MATHTERERLERLLLGQQNILAEVHLLLADEQKQDDLLRAMVFSSTEEKTVRLSSMDPERIFHREAIRDTCVRYRLRFLPAAYFKGPLPHQAVHALRVLERKADGPIRSFMIMAPPSRFKLCDSEADPLLFVPVGDDRFYLVHKWGNDLAPYRSLVNWPLRSPLTLAIVVLMVAFALAALVPTSLLTTEPGVGHWGTHRFVMMFWSTMVCASFTVFGWFAFFGQFSKEAWNSRYFN
ncbi:MAG: hypothetical protein JNM62_03405 [Flavobacteriales bacterium]|nr:hypothetical protein [Flavobacteriales bacterium]